MEECEFYINEFGSKIWYRPSKGRGYRHRPSGPAVENVSGTKEWWVNSQRHREDGPAVECANGTKGWCINGQQLDTQEVETWLNENQVDLTTEEGRMAFKLSWT